MSSGQRCRRAVIALAGYGTRRLPITKAIEKSMLPIGNRPIIDYIVDDCVAAGITDIIFVVNKKSEQVREYYGRSELLESYLERKNAAEPLQTVRGLTAKAKFSFVVQENDEPYGTSIPLWLARDLLPPGEPFLYLYGDNVFHVPSGPSTITQFVEQAARIAAPTAMMVVEVPQEKVHLYGIVATRQEGGIAVLDRIVEKPAPEAAPSNLNNAGCFLLSDDILPYVERSITHAPQAEKYVTDAITWYANDGRSVAVITASGEYLDCGNLPGWLYANNRICGETN